MYKARYYKNDGKKGKARALPDWLFDGVVHEPALHRAVKAYQANQRQGTASAKNRAAVRGGSRKPWRQKGTGRARQGTIRAVQWAGGGRAFPPQPHSWRETLPKKVRGLARRSAFNDRAEQERIILFDAPDFEAPKTRQLLDYLSTVEAEGKILVLTDGVRKNVYLSGRNVPELQVKPFGEESVYDILWAGTILIERSALERATEEAEAKATAKAEAKAAIAATPAEAAPAAAAPEAPAEEEVAEEAPEAEASVATEETSAEEVEEAEEEAERVAEAEAEVTNESEPEAEDADEASDEEKKEGDDA